MQQTARPMFGGFSMLCLSTVSFTPSHLPQPLIVHRAYKNEVVDIYDVTAVGRQVRVKTNKGWASMVSRNGLPLLVPDKDFLYAVIKAQTIWRMIYIRKQQVSSGQPQTPLRWAALAAAHARVRGDRGSCEAMIITRSTS